LKDEEEIDAKAGGGQPITIGVMVRQLLTKLDWYDTLFPRIPVPIQMSIDSKLAAKFPAVRQVERHEPVANRENRDWRREENAISAVRSRDSDRREEREQRKPPRARSRSRSRSRDRRADRGEFRDRSDRDREQRNNRDRERDRGQRDRNRGQRERSRSRDRKRRDDRR